MPDAEDREICRLMGETRDMLYVVAVDLAECVQYAGRINAAFAEMNKGIGSILGGIPKERKS